MYKNIMRRALESLALEDGAIGVAKEELEHVYYAQLKDLGELTKAASVEKQEQWSVKIPHVAGSNMLEGQLRVRKTEDAGNVSYVLTAKCPGKDGGRKEVESESCEDMFTMFKFFSSQGMIKHRHRFPVEGSKLVWEVDVYLKADGSYHDWVKIDLEVSSLEDEVPALPVKIDEDTIVRSARDKMTAEEKAKVTKLYDDVFLSKNAYLKDAAPAAGEAPPADAAQPEAAPAQAPAETAPAETSGDEPVEAEAAPKAPEIPDEAPKTDAVKVDE